MKDFYFTGDDYRYHIEVDAKIRFLELLKDRFNSGVRYRSKTWNWDTVIQLKTQESARFLLPKSVNIDFLEPTPDLRRADWSGIRRRILELTQGEAKKLGIGRSTLHYLRRKAFDKKPFKVYQKVAKKLEAN